METETLPHGLWRDDEGQIYLERCPKCGRENYALRVATGVCAWCGYSANEDLRLNPSISRN